MSHADAILKILQDAERRRQRSEAHSHMLLRRELLRGIPASASPYHHVRTRLLLSLHDSVGRISAAEGVALRAEALLARTAGKGRSRR